VAKARRDPAIVAPVIAALEVLAAIYARLKATSPSCERRARTCCSRSTSCTRRPAP
jgi:hypothetical protein